MPGPSNSKRKKKANPKKQKRPNDSSDPKPPSLTGKLSPEPLQIPRRRPLPSPPPPPPLASQRNQSATQETPKYRSESCEDSSYPPSPLLTPPPFEFDYNYDHYLTSASKERIVPEECIEVIEKVLNKPPFIHDPGNGPRVRDTKEFLRSEFFAQPPAFDDPLCAEFAQPEVLQMLQTVLPEETAMILWYNKSRATGRICPACQRLYRLGDTLPEHDVGNGEQQREAKPPPPQLRLEQAISGLCSPVCFVLASFTFPGAIKAAWGKMAEEIDDEAWELLNSSNTRPRSASDTSHALGMIVRMTRLHDLGLGQLCFSPEEAEAFAADHEED